MTNPQQASQKNTSPKRDSMLRDERLKQLLDNCQQEVLRQIVGPFGLTPAMFDDKDGGNVTTQHNAEKEIYAKDSEKFKRSDYDYAVAKSKKKEESVKNGSMNSQMFEDKYTGRMEPTRRIKRNGKQAMNAELDHTIPIKDIHKDGGWMKDRKGRTKLSSIEDNLNYTTFQTNRSKSNKSPEAALVEDKGFDKQRIDPIIDNAKEALDKELPNITERLKYHGKELAKEGAKEAAKNAVRHALGILLHEFVSGSFGEIKKLLKDRNNEQNLIDRLVDSLKHVMNRVIKKLKTALNAALQGGVQGFFSSLLTFLINNLITTSKKIVTIIRESMQSLWRAIQLIANPHESMSTLDVTREITKIIAAVVTTGLGMLLEESVKGFIMSIPMLAPIADMLATALTAIMTGITGALIVYSIDRLFDWLNSTGTELLAAQESNAEAQAVVISNLHSWLSLQYENSSLYKVCVAEYEQIQNTYSETAILLETTSISAMDSIKSKGLVIANFETQLDRSRRLQDELNSL